MYKMATFGLNSQSGLPQSAYRIGGSLTVLIAHRTALCMAKNVFKGCLQFIFQELCVAVMCQPLYASVMRPAEMLATCATYGFQSLIAS